MNENILNNLNNLIVNYLALYGIYKIKDNYLEDSSIYVMFKKISKNNSNFYIDLLNSKNVLMDVELEDSDIISILDESFTLYENINNLTIKRDDENNLLSIIMDDKKMYNETVNNIFTTFKVSLKYLVYNNEINSKNISEIKLKLLNSEMLEYVNVEDYYKANEIKIKISEIKKGTN